MSQYGENLVLAFYNHLDVQDVTISDKAMVIAQAQRRERGGKLIPV